MNEHDAVIDAQEYNLPPPESEYAQPRPESEYAAPAPEEPLSAATSGGAQDERGSGRFKKLLRYTAALATAGAISLSVAGRPARQLETVDVESYIEIECAAVMPEEPEYLRFQYMDYRSLYDEVPVYKDDDFHFYLLTPSGGETELTREEDPELYRAVYMPPTDSYKAVYSEVAAPGDYFNLNAGWELWRSEIGSFEPGSVLKIVCTYEADGVIRRMTSSREIVMLPTPSEKTVTVETRPQETGMSEVKFEAVLHPTDESFRYVFGNKAASQMSLCTRWYDTEGNDLGKGWLFAIPPYASQAYPEIWLYGDDYVFRYSGPVRSTATDPDAAYYTLVLTIAEESTGWHLRFESEPIPVTSANIA